MKIKENKDNVEIVGWYTFDKRNLDRIKRQAEKNGGELVILSSKDKVESLSTPQTNLSSDSKDTTKPKNKQHETKADTTEIDKAIAKAEAEGNIELL